MEKELNFTKMEEGLMVILLVEKRMEKVNLDG